MSYQLDFENAFNHDEGADNFGTCLLRLVMKASLHNLSLLKKSFPNAVKTVEEWRETGQVPDYRYD